MNKNLKVGIVGAGIQGVSNALFLQKKGFIFEVLLFQKDAQESEIKVFKTDNLFSFLDIIRGNLQKRGADRIFLHFV